MPAAHWLHPRTIVQAEGAVCTSARSRSRSTAMELRQTMSVPRRHMFMRPSAPHVHASFRATCLCLSIFTTFIFQPEPRCLPLQALSSLWRIPEAGKQRGPLGVRILPAATSMLQLSAAMSCELETSKDQNMTKVRQLGPAATRCEGGTGSTSLAESAFQGRRTGTGGFLSSWPRMETHEGFCIASGFQPT